MSRGSSSALAIADSGDLVKHHPLDGDFWFQHLDQVPGDGLTLAVFVSGQVEFRSGGELLLERRDLFLFSLRNDVERLEAVVDVDTESRPRLALVLFRNLGGGGRQIADVADGRFHDIVRPEEPGDGPRLGWRFDNNEGFAIGHRAHRRTECALLVKQKVRKRCRLRVV